MLMSISCCFVTVVMVQVLFGVLLLVYVPNLDPYPGYTPMPTESVEDSAYEELPGGEQERISPERHVNLFSSKFQCTLIEKVSIPRVKILMKRQICHKVSFMTNRFVLFLFLFFCFCFFVFVC